MVGFLLARQGHEPVILETQNRVGGWIYTRRTSAPSS
jgi:protoporphyrinogen oxidase